MEVAEGCIPEQNRPLVPILASAKAVGPAITYDFGLEVERRSTPHNYTNPDIALAGGHSHRVKRFEATK
ncbi:hypothetical protein THAOC_29820, partial [Thalassiosira oceanica]